MSVIDLAVPTAFNTLDDEPFDDGHPVSSWAGRELLHNDRGLHAWCRRNLLCKAWDLDNLYTLQRHHWIQIAAVPCSTTPGVKTVTVRFRGIITNGLDVIFAVQSMDQFSQTRPNNASALTAETGTGAVANWEIAGVPVRAGQQELIQVYAACNIQADAAGDVTGAASDVGVNNIQSAAAFGGISAGYAIRLEETANNEPLTNYHQILFLPSTSYLVVSPDWQGWREHAARFQNSGAVGWRAKPVAELELYSLSIDEDELSGEIGA